jgi:hypothetical protein
LKLSKKFPTAEKKKRMAASAYFKKTKRKSLTFLIVFIRKNAADAAF